MKFNLFASSIEVMAKKTYDNSMPWKFADQDGNLQAAYIPNLPIDDNSILDQLAEVPFNRVYYVSKYGKANRTPRETWAYGKIPNDDTSIIHYRGLDFTPEPMPPWLEQLAQFCNQISTLNWGFTPNYNSCIIGRYDSGDDQIGKHFDTETFLAHHFCANVTLGEPRDFQFFTKNADGSSQTHEIKLAHKSVFFFNGLEHALPKRAKVKPNSIRYSISFRNMQSNVGIGNSFYYCRGIGGAVNNQNKQEYQAKLQELLQITK